MRTYRRKRGISLIETIVAIVVVGIAIPPLVSLFGEVSARGTDESYQGVAMAYANALMEEIVSKAYEDPEEATGSFGTEEGSRAAYDDVDDFDGLSNSPPTRIDGTSLNEYTGFTRSVTVDNVTAANPDPTITAVDGSTEFKRIQVSVAWTGGRAGELTLSTLRTMLEPSPVVEPGTLISHWRLDESGGTEADDHDGDNDGTYTNGVTLDVTGTPNGGDAVAFDGVDDYVEIPHSSDFLLDDGTIQFWFRADDLLGHQAMFSKDSTGNDTGGHVHIYLLDDDVEVRLQSTTQSYTLNASSEATALTWHHVAFTFGTAGMKLYVDGVLHDTDTYTGGLGTTSGGSGNHEPLVLGAGSWLSGDLVATPTSYHYDGRIDEVGIFDGALSAAEIMALYEADGDIE